MRIHVIEVPVAEDTDSALPAIHGSARALHKVQAIDDTTMAQFDETSGIRPPSDGRPRSCQHP